MTQLSPFNSLAIDATRGPTSRTGLANMPMEIIRHIVSMANALFTEEEQRSFFCATARVCRGLLIISQEQLYRKLRFADTGNSTLMETLSNNSFVASCVREINLTWACLPQNAASEVSWPDVILSSQMVQFGKVFRSSDQLKTVWISLVCYNSAFDGPLPSSQQTDGQILAGLQVPSVESLTISSTETSLSTSSFPLFFDIFPMIKELSLASKSMSEQYTEQRLTVS